MWMKKAEFGLGNKTIVGSCSNSLRNTNPRGIHHRKLMGALPLVYNHKGTLVPEKCLSWDYGTDDM